MSINVLLIGSGGREHTLAWGIAKSPLLKKLYTAPGNPGTESLGENVNLDVSDHAAVLDFVRSNDIDLTVIGPEQPLVEGIADVLENAGHKVFGPKQQAAMLEGSKEFAKDFMARNRRIENSPLLQLQQNRLSREVTVLIGVFTTLKQQYETTKIEEYRDSNHIIIKSPKTDSFWRPEVFFNFFCIKINFYHFFIK